MPTIGEMLNTEARQALIGVKAVSEPRIKGEPKTKRTKAGLPVRDCICEKRNDGFRRDGNDLVHKGCGYPRKQVSTLIGAVAQPTTMTCAGDCNEPVTVVARKDDHTLSLMGPRLVVCRDCAANMLEGKTGEIVRMSEMPVPVVRKEGCATAAVQITTTQEKNMTVNISSLSPLAIGTAVMDAERARLAAEMPAKKKKAEKKRAKVEAAEKVERREQRVSLTSLETLPGFTLKTVVVPDLEVSAINSLDEVPARTFRSPYNKLRARHQETLHLAKDNAEDEGEGKACTWIDLINDHVRFAKMAEDVVEPVEPVKESKTLIASAVSLDEKVQIKALRKALGITKAEAKAILATV